MCYDEAFALGWSFSATLWTLIEQIAAFRIMQVENEVAQLGTIVSLSAGVQLTRCRGGFNDRTLKVRSGDCFYFVFIQDLETHGQAANRASEG